MGGKSSRAKLPWVADSAFLVERVCSGSGFSDTFTDSNMCFSIQAM